MTREEAALLLRDYFEEASEAQTLDEWDRVFIKYVKRLSEKENEVLSNRTLQGGPSRAGDALQGPRQEGA